MELYFDQEVVEAKDFEIMNRCVVSTHIDRIHFTRKVQKITFPDIPGLDIDTVLSFDDLKEDFDMEFFKKHRQETWIGFYFLTDFDRQEGTAEEVLKRKHAFEMLNRGLTRGRKKNCLYLPKEMEQIDYAQVAPYLSKKGDNCLYVLSPCAQFRGFGPSTAHLNIVSVAQTFPQGGLVVPFDHYTFHFYRLAIGRFVLVKEKSASRNLAVYWQTKMKLLASRNRKTGNIAYECMTAETKTLWKILVQKCLKISDQLSEVYFDREFFPRVEALCLPSTLKSLTIHEPEDGSLPPLILNFVDIPVTLFEHDSECLKKYEVCIEGYRLLKRDIDKDRIGELRMKIFCSHILDGRYPLDVKEFALTESVRGIRLLKEDYQEKGKLAWTYTLTKKKQI